MVATIAAISSTDERDIAFLDALGRTVWDESYPDPWMARGIQQFPHALRRAWMKGEEPPPDVKLWWTRAQRDVLIKFPNADEIVASLIADLNRVLPLSGCDAYGRPIVREPRSSSHDVLLRWIVERCPAIAVPQFVADLHKMCDSELAVKGPGLPDSTPLLRERVDVLIECHLSEPSSLVNSARALADKCFPLLQRKRHRMPWGVLVPLAPLLWYHERLTTEELRLISGLDTMFLMKGHNEPPSAWFPFPTLEQLERIRAEARALFYDEVDEVIRTGSTPEYMLEKVRQMQRRVSGLDDLLRSLRWLCRAKSKRDLDCAAEFLLAIPAPSEEDRARSAEMRQVDASTLFTAGAFKPEWTELIASSRPEPEFAALTDASTWISATRFGRWEEAAERCPPATSPADMAIARDELLRATSKLGEARTYAFLNHRLTRSYAKCSAMFANAVLGQNAVDIEAGFAKRDKFAVAALGLLPLEDDLVERYQALMRFEEEAKQFGPQRQKSERLAVQAGLVNLAVTAGYATVADLALAMERAAASGPSPFDRTWQISGYDLRLLDCEKYDIVASKLGKRLKSVPAKVKADPAFSEVRETRDRLIAQASRISQRLRTMLETGATLDENQLRTVVEFPVSARLLHGLVVHAMRRGEATADFYLWDDIAAQPEDFTAVSIAHPLGLEAANLLGQFQHAAVERGYRPIADQLFRCRYHMSEQERTGFECARLAGQSVMLGSLRTTLAKEGWAPAYDTSFSKKTADMEAEFDLADYVSYGESTQVVTTGPVSFRQGSARLSIGDVEPLVFSETLRVIDRAITTAIADKAIGHCSPELLIVREELVRAYRPPALVADGTVTVAGVRVDLRSGTATREDGASITLPDAPLPDNFPIPSPDPKTAKIIAGVLSLER